jgi:Cd2+/Zn2+-exporting ATPase
MDFVSATAESVSASGTVLYLSVDSVYSGCIIIGDTVKSDAHGLSKALGTMGIRTALLTGDSHQAAEKIGQELNIDELYSELLPQQKVKVMDTLKETSRGNIAYIGDGINDAPVLSMSDIGVAMGGIGSDAAIEAADIIFMNDEPSKILTAVKIAKRTRKIVWESIVFALSVKLLFLILGALSLAGMWHAVFADVGVSLIAVLNAMRILKVNRI